MARVKQTTKPQGLKAPRSNVAKIANKMVRKTIKPSSNEEESSYEEEEEESSSSDESVVSIVPKKIGNSYEQARNEDRLNGIMPTEEEKSQMKKRQKRHIRSLQNDEFSKALVPVRGGIEADQSDTETIPSREEVERSDSETEAGSYAKAEISDFEEGDEDEQNELELIFYRVLYKIDEHLEANEGTKLGKRFWKKLTVDERKAIYAHKEQFIAEYKAKSVNGFISDEWLDNQYQKYLYESPLNRKQQKAKQKLKKALREQSNQKVEQNILTKNFYAISNKKADRPVITDDLKVRIIFAPEFLDLEAIPPETTEKIKGFENLEDYQRMILMQKLIDVRDGTNKAQEIINDQELDENANTIYENFKNGHNIHKIKQTQREIFGVRAAAQEDD